MMPPLLSTGAQSECTIVALPAVEGLCIFWLGWGVLSVPILYYCKIPCTSRLPLHQAFKVSSLNTGFLMYWFSLKPLVYQFYMYLLPHDDSEGFMIHAKMPLYLVILFRGYEQWRYNAWIQRLPSLVIGDVRKTKSLVSKTSSCPSHNTVSKVLLFQDTKPAELPRFPCWDSHHPPP